ncbi:MAG: DNA-binding protein [Oscillospiraceae bacterium]|nr:DNA-binding protein [Oscillospiraceae bacterium]
MTARMRTITEAIKAIREADPQTAFTETALRNMIRRGEIPSVKAGCKNLVNLDVLFEYLNNPTSQSVKIVSTSTGIRPIKEKIFH